jgi:hypothetical protein
MVVSPIEGHELAYILGDLSQSVRNKGGEYVVYKCLFSGELKWAEYDGEEGSFDPQSDILIRC